MTPMNPEKFQGNRSENFSEIRNTDTQTETATLYIYIYIYIDVPKPRDIIR